MLLLWERGWLACADGQYHWHTVWGSFHTPCVGGDWILIAARIGPFVLVALFDTALFYQITITLYGVRDGLLKLDLGVVASWEDLVREFHKAPARCACMRACACAWGPCACGVAVRCPARMFACMQARRPCGAIAFTLSGHGRGLATEHAAAYACMHAREAGCIRLPPPACGPGKADGQRCYCHGTAAFPLPASPLGPPPLRMHACVRARACVRAWPQVVGPLYERAGQQQPEEPAAAEHGAALHRRPLDGCACVHAYRCTSCTQLYHSAGWGRVGRGEEGAGPSYADAVCLAVSTTVVRSVGLRGMP